MRSTLLPIAIRPLKATDIKITLSDDIDRFQLRFDHLDDLKYSLRSEVALIFLEIIKPKFKRLSLGPLKDFNNDQPQELSSFANIALEKLRFNLKITQHQSAQLLAIVKNIRADLGDQRIALFDVSDGLIDASYQIIYNGLTVERVVINRQLYDYYQDKNSGLQYLLAEPLMREILTKILISATDDDIDLEDNEYIQLIEPFRRQLDLSLTDLKDIDSLDRNVNDICDQFAKHHQIPTTINQLFQTNITRMKRDKR